MAYARHRARGQDRDPDRPRATGRSASQSRRGRARGAPRVDGAVREQSGNFGFDYWMVDRRELADILPGLSPRLSGLAVVPLERQLRRVEIGWRLGFEETIQAPAMHQIGADQSGEDERTVDGLLRRLGETEQQKGDQRDGDLDAHGIFRGAEKAADFEGLLDPAEEQLDRPASLVERGDLGGRSIEVVAQDAQHLAGIELDANLTQRVLE